MRHVAGALHAKCAVADGRRPLVSSANLTEHAQWLNMELGVLVEGGDTPRRAQRHWSALIGSGEIERIRPDAAGNSRGTA